MKILSQPTAFDWDQGNSDKNFVKHKVTNKEAEEVFENDPKFIFADQSHSKKEQRYGLFGQTDRGRRLSIVFTIRQNKVRIITARDMSRKERRGYEKIKKNSKI